MCIEGDPSGIAGFQGDLNYSLFTISQISSFTLSFTRLFIEDILNYIDDFLFGSSVDAAPESC